MTGYAPSPEMNENTNTEDRWVGPALRKGRCPVTGTPLRICFCGHVEFPGHRPPLGAQMTLRDSWDLGEFVDGGHGTIEDTQ